MLATYRQVALYVGQCQLDRETDAALGDGATPPTETHPGEDMERFARRTGEIGQSG